GSLARRRRRRRPRPVLGGDRPLDPRPRETPRGADLVRECGTVKARPALLRPPTAAGSPPSPAAAPGRPLETPEAGAVRPPPRVGCASWGQPCGPGRPPGGTSRSDLVISSTLTSLKVTTRTLRTNRAGRYMSQTQASSIVTSKYISPLSVLRGCRSTWLVR